MTPLSGIRVLDFSRHMAGPHATAAMSDYGADVIKVETLRGDPSRFTGVDFVGDESALFLMWNRGKRSISLDLTQPEATEVVKKLVATVDVVVENYRPGQADKFGFGYEELSAINDQIVYVSVSAFGAEGPLAALPGTDPVVQAASGIMSVTGERDGGPNLVGIPIADYAGSMQCMQAVLLGLLARERTGRGQHVKVSMLAGLLSSLTTRLASYWVRGENPQRFGSAHSIVVPYEAFQTSDGYAVAGVWGGNDGWRPFCEVINRLDLFDEPRFRQNADRVRHREELRKILEPVFASRTTKAWAEDFHSRGVLFSPVNTFSDILEHEQVTSSGLLQTVEHPTLGSIPQLGPVVDLTDTPGRISGPPPLLGQHSIEILQEAGLDENEIASLIGAGVVGTFRDSAMAAAESTNASTPRS